MIDKESWMVGWLVGQCCLAATTVRMSQESVKKCIFLIIFFLLLASMYKFQVKCHPPGLFSVRREREGEREKQC